MKLLLLSSLFIVSSFASQELDRFAKCYKQFTGEVVSTQHVLFLNVKNGSLDGKKACRELLKSADLKNGFLGNKSDDAKKILHNFTVLHNSFFSNIPKKGGDERYVYDRNDRAYYLLMALFSTGGDGKENYPFKNIFTDDNTYRPIRERKSQNSYIVEWIGSPGTAVYEGLFPYPLCGDGGWNKWGDDNLCSSFPFTYQKIDPRILEDAKVDVSSGLMVEKGSSERIRDGGRTLDIGRWNFDRQGHNALLTTHNWPWSVEDIAPQGEIVGIQPVRGKSLPHVFQRAFNSADGYYRAYIGPALEQPYPKRVDNFYDNLGAGLLFTPNFQESLGLDSDQVNVQNGVDKVPRAWTQEIIQDFLCREIPVIRQSDAVKFIVQERSPAAPFRNSASCMRCHATIDALSFIARNYQYSRTSPRGGNNIWVNNFHEPSKEPETKLPTEADLFFPVRPANGNFRYRDYIGQFHDVSLNATQSNPRKSMQEFGEYLSRIDDPYICMTSKYFEYLTGIRPLLFDPGDEGAPVLSERDRAIQSYLFRLGQELKKSGNLKSVLLDIVSSDLYIDPEASL